MAYESLEPAGPDDYKKRQEAIKRTITKAATKSGAQILKKQAKQANRDKPEIREKCELARMLFHEGIDMFESGDMTFEQFANDLHRSLLAVAGSKETPTKESEKESDDE